MARPRRSSQTPHLLDKAEKEHKTHHGKTKIVSGERQQGRYWVGDLGSCSAGMTIGAVDLREISDIDRMLERGGGVGRCGGSPFRFRHHRMALVTVSADNASVCAYVLAIVTAEASR